MSDNPYTGPDETGGAPPPSSLSHIVELGVVIGIIAVLAILLMPAIQQSHEPRGGPHCKNNVKQMALALHNYHEVYGSFPPAFTVDETGRRLHSWRTLILPFIDQNGLYKTVDLTKPWDDPANAAAREAVVAVYLCPSLGDRSGKTTYLGVVGEGLFFPPEGTRTFSDIPDQSGTAAIIEVDAAHAVHWMEPSDADERLIQSLQSGLKLPHQDGVHVARADGSIRLLPATLPASDRLKLLTIADDGVPEGW